MARTKPGSHTVHDYGCGVKCTACGRPHRAHRWDQRRDALCDFAISNLAQRVQSHLPPLARGGQGGSRGMAFGSHLQTPQIGVTRAATARHYDTVSEKESRVSKFGTQIRLKEFCAMTWPLRAGTIFHPTPPAPPC